MKCINKKTQRILALFVLMMISLSGCGQIKYDFAYEADSEISSFNVSPVMGCDTLEAFAADLCVVQEDLFLEDLDMSEASAAVLFDVKNKEVLFSKNPHERMYPASITKIMTALVALENCSLGQTLAASNAVNISESGAQLCGLKSGDTMTLDQALHVLLMYSANDVAMMIAENVGGSVEHFVEMMNEEAKRLGATNTNFTNPHGLSDEKHYTTAYDLYLIFNEAIKFDTINEIMHMTSYQTTYFSKDGKAKELSFKTTNLFLREDYKAPDHVTVIGGKTGTTNAAGHCLLLLSRDTSGSPYISVILRSSSTDVLYTEMSNLLGKIPK